MHYKIKLYIHYHNTGEEDFSTAAVELVIIPPDTSGCATIAIYEDEKLEGNEMFSVTVTSSNPAVLLSSSTAVVTIKDNDGIALHA